jgi:hypothetical protein
MRRHHPFLVLLALLFLRLISASVPLSFKPVYEQFWSHNSTDNKYTNRREKLWLKYIQEDLVPPALHYWTSILKVKDFYQIPAHQKMSNNYFKGKSCNFSHYKEPSSTNYETSQHLLFLEARYEDGYLMMTSSCELINSRATASLIRFNLKKMQKKAHGSPPADYLWRELYLIGFLHEVGHGIGFALYLFQHFATPIKLSTTDTSFRAVVPKHLDTLLKHVNCSQGTVYESFMNGGTWFYNSGHFLDKVYGPELMTTEARSLNRLTNFTLSILEDSGWYEVDYKKAELTTWGLNKGCDFLEQKVSSISFPNEFCQREDPFDLSTTPFHCEPNFGGKGKCTLQLNPITSSLYMAEIGNAATDRRCEGSTRCLSSKIIAIDSTISATDTVLCVRTECDYSVTGSPPKVLVIMGAGAEEVTKVCLTPNVTFFTNEAQIVINCPDAFSFCEYARYSCPRNCMSRGTCINGFCSCQKGYTGLDCSIEITGVVTIDSINKSPYTFANVNFEVLYGKTGAKLLDAFLNSKTIIVEDKGYIEIVGDGGSEDSIELRRRLQDLSSFKNDYSVQYDILGTSYKLQYAWNVSFHENITTRNSLRMNLYSSSDLLNPLATLLYSDSLVGNWISWDLQFLKLQISIFMNNKIKPLIKVIIDQSPSAFDYAFILPLKLDSYAISLVSNGVELMGQQLYFWWQRWNFINVYDDYYYIGTSFSSGDMLQYFYEDLSNPSMLGVSPFDTFDSGFLWEIKPVKEYSESAYQIRSFTTKQLLYLNTSSSTMGLAEVENIQDVTASYFRINEYKSTPATKKLIVDFISASLTDYEMGLTFDDKLNMVMKADFKDWWLIPVGKHYVISNRFGSRYLHIKKDSIPTLALSAGCDYSSAYIWDLQITNEGWIQIVPIENPSYLIASNLMKPELILKPTSNLNLSSSGWYLRKDTILV